MRVLRIYHSAVVDAWRERERALCRVGVDVRLLTARRWNEGGTDVALEPRPGEHVAGMRTWGRHPALFVYDPRPLWRALGERWDVIDVHEEPFSLAAAEVLVLRRLRRQRAPYTLYSAQNIDKRYPPPFRWTERWALRHAAGISVCNADAAAIVSRKGLPGVPSVIPLGVDPDLFQPAPDRWRSDSVEVGYVGRLAAHKGIDVLLAAIVRDARLRLSIVGAGPLEADLREQVRELQVEQRVQFLGPVAQELLPAVYGRLDLLAVPSLPVPGWREQFGRVAAEAMSCGVPVVASASGALPETIGEGGRTVPPADPTALADALIELGTDSAALARAREAARVRAGAFTWDTVAAQQLEMYCRATHAPSGSVSTREVEVVVVAYGAPRLLIKALAPLRGLPVTVVDNSSSPEVRKVCTAAGVRYLDARRNRGFAAGVNLALRDRLRPGADVLLLNPDAVISAADVALLQRALHAGPELASVGPHQVDGAGRPARVWWPFPSPLRTWLEAVGLGRWGLVPDGARGFVIGSILMLRAEALEQVGPLDERFFLYAEETDWAFRASRLGWRHAVVADAEALHIGAATSSSARDRELQFHASQERFLRKHWGPWGWRTARAGQLLGSAIRIVALQGERRDAARHRLALYLRGPLAQAQRPRAPTSTAPGAADSVSGAA